MVGKKRFVMNPFPSMDLSSGDKVQLQKTADSLLGECMQSYETYLKDSERQMTFEERKTSFCPLCIKEAFDINTPDAARAQISGSTSQYAFNSGTDYSFASSSDSERNV
ncbi:hypothetical protein KRP22_004680 [Phytophthora ramorum]|nr:hypothetical protein KRP22_10311 [Phytophthora ramorum]